MTTKLWKNRDAEEIDPTLFSDQAEALARKFAEDHTASKDKHNKRTQLRKFYDEVLRLETSVRSNTVDWKTVLPMTHMLTAKAAYAFGRNLVSQNFLNFIKEGVSQIRDPKDLRLFCTLFEAVMGFYRQHGPSN